MGADPFLLLDHIYNWYNFELFEFGYWSNKRGEKRISSEWGRASGYAL